MRLASLLLLGLTLAASASAQISFTGEYYQDFDDLGTAEQAALPEGWRVETSPAVIKPGAYADVPGTATDLRGGSFFASDSPAGVVNFGSGPEATATERALGFSLRQGEVESGILYVHFVNDSGAPIQENLKAVASESYRGGGPGRVYTDEFFSRDGVTWTATQAMGSSLISGFPDGDASPPIGGASSSSTLTLETPILPGQEWYLAYRFYTLTPTAPAQALDEFALVSPADEAGVVFLSRGEVDFGEIVVGERQFFVIDFQVLPSGADAGIAEITGPDAADFEVSDVDADASSQYVEVWFTPSTLGARGATLRLAASDTLSRPVTLRGIGVESNVTASDDDVASGQVQMDVWPNPSAGPVQFRIGVDASGPARLSIHDALGREVAVVLDKTLTLGAHDATFDAARLVPGVYFTRLVTQDETVTSALTISR